MTAGCRHSGMPATSNTPPEQLSAGAIRTSKRTVEILSEWAATSTASKTGPGCGCRGAVRDVPLLPDRKVGLAVVSLGGAAGTLFVRAARSQLREVTSSKGHAKGKVVVAVRPIRDGHSMTGARSGEGSSRRVPRHPVRRLRPVAPPPRHRPAAVRLVVGVLAAAPAFDQRLRAPGSGR